MQHTLEHKPWTIVCLNKVAGKPRGPGRVIEELRQAALLAAGDMAHPRQLHQHLGVWLDNLSACCHKWWDTRASYDPSLTCLLGRSP
ncbi:hypothetical protein HaLaN_28010, partial [Haematococcus lacustris]